MWLRLLDIGTTTLVALLPIVNPPGAAAVFFSLTASDGAAFRRAQARRTALTMLAILALFLLLGRLILHYFGISFGALQIAGGLVVGHAGWEMLTNSDRLTSPEKTDAHAKDDISFIPMALPLLSGPGAIGVLIALSAAFSQAADYVAALAGCVVLAAITYAVLVLGEPLVKLLGESGLGAIRRLLGFFILAIAVDLISLGVLALKR